MMQDHGVVVDKQPPGSQFPGGIPSECLGLVASFLTIHGELDLSYPKSPRLGCMILEFVFMPSVVQYRCIANT